MSDEQMIAYSRYKQIGDENLFLMEQVRKLQAENEAVKESNKNLMGLVTMLREEVNKLREMQK